jgi:hypothetical protein
LFFFIKKRKKEGIDKPFFLFSISLNPLKPQKRGRKKNSVSKKVSTFFFFLIIISLSLSLNKKARATSKVRD